MKTTLGILLFILSGLFFVPIIKENNRDSFRELINEDYISLKHYYSSLKLMHLDEEVEINKLKQENIILKNKIIYEIKKIKKP